jgi:hypothetical protein
VLAQTNSQHNLPFSLAAEPLGIRALSADERHSYAMTLLGALSSRIHGALELAL